MMKMFSKTALIAALAIPVMAQADTLTWDGGGANNLWSTAENWSNDAIPASENDYIVDGVLFRSPDAAASVFAGDSLTVQNGAILNLYRSNGGGLITSTYTFNSLVVDNATIRPQSSTGSTSHVLHGSLSFTGAVTIDMKENSNLYTQRLSLGQSGGSDTLTGSGSLLIERDATGSERTTYLYADASGYSGDITVASLVNEVLSLNIYNTTGWGTGDLTAGHYSSLKLLNASGVDASSSGVSLDATAELNLGDGASTFGSLTIAGNSVAADTYTAADLTALGFGGTFTGAGTVTVVPEPGSLALLGLGGLMIARRRRD